MNNDIFYSAFGMKRRVWLEMFCGLLMVSTLSACTGDRYQQQADAIKGHVEMFYGHLQSHQPDQAVADFKRIIARVAQWNREHPVFRYARNGNPTFPSGLGDTLFDRPRLPYVSAFVAAGS